MKEYFERCEELCSIDAGQVGMKVNDMTWSLKLHKGTATVELNHRKHERSLGKHRSTLTKDSYTRLGVGKSGFDGKTFQNAEERNINKAN